mgnify:FL=1
MMPSPDIFPVPLIHISETNSTNNYLQSLCSKQKVEELTVVVADFQTSGRGQRGNSWESDSGKNLLFSIVIFPEFLEARRQFLISQIISLAIKEELDTYTTDISIKWPNDIVMNKKKVCGILTEMSTEIDYINYVVIGVGINVNQKVFDEELKEKATSLMIETGAPVKRSALIAAVMKHFEKNYALFMENGDLSGLQESYNEMLVNRGKEVRILEPGNEYNAHAYGINETGELIVRTQKGEEKHIFAGEVSVRGIYGYV